MAENKKPKKKVKTDEETVTIRANVTLKKDEYEKYKSGETKSNKGLRGDDGKLSSIPDFEEIKDEEVYYIEDVRPEIEQRERNIKEVMFEEVVVPVLEETAEKVADAVVDAAVKAIGYVWQNAVVPAAKKGAKAVSNKANEIKENRKERKQKKLNAEVVAKQPVKSRKRTKAKDKTIEHTPEITLNISIFYHSPSTAIIRQKERNIYSLIFFTTVCVLGSTSQIKSHARPLTGYVVSRNSINGKFRISKTHTILNNE